MIRFIIADLRKYWIGSAVVVLIVALAVALGVAVTLQERALRLGSARAADKFDLVIGAAGSENQLVLSSVFLQASPLPLMDGAVLAKLAADPRVAWAAPIGFGDSFEGYPIVGTTTVLVANLADGLAEGKVFTQEGEAVIGANVDLALGDEIKPMHGTMEEGGQTHTELAYHVSGRLKPTGTAWDRAILVPIQAVWHIHGMGHEEHEHKNEAGKAPEADHDEHQHHGESHADAPLDEHWDADVPGLPAILVKPKTIADAYKLRQEYRADATVAVFPGEVLTRLYATLGDAKRVLFAVAAGSQVLVAASLLLVTVMHVGQRRRQIGALRAFGAPRHALFAIVWLELFALVLVGIALGFALGYAAARAISNLVSEGSGVSMPVGFSGEDMTFLIVLTLFAALISALPAILAYRQSPAAALRA
ncbi:ABC transporter permease [Rhizobium sp. TH2]|uniref:ABC transporter permease n=1 Tax=Rhizobium sp. TH2 TaxID=2775403 RepID=UPI00215816B4|nr:ABC transporter permease [Rhizobium sp. TH2]UVC07946.1 ABC transporter permease [Rhizobium sp. TH2]